MGTGLPSLLAFPFETTSQKDAAAAAGCCVATSLVAVAPKPGLSSREGSSFDIKGFTFSPCLCPTAGKQDCYGTVQRGVLG